MEEIYGSPSNWGFYYHDEGIEELKHFFLYTTLELENAVLSAHEDLARKEDELMHLKTLLANTIKERDDAQAKCQRLSVEKFIIQQQLQASCLTCNIEDELSKKADSVTLFSTSACDENFTASPAAEHVLPQPLPPNGDVAEKMIMNKALPEKGKFLQAVIEAGPLLQTLLLAGPLPQWQHPPPQLITTEIPLVTISSPRPPPLHQESCVSINGCLGKKSRRL